jgi:hypothetical protein
MSDEMFAEAPDPREGIGPAVRFVAESLLAIGISLRVASHVIGAGYLYGQPEEVDTGLQAGFAVSKPTLETEEQLQVAGVSAGCIGMGGAMMAGFAAWSWSPALLGLLAANLLYAAGDPVWLLLDYYAR